MLIPRSHVWTPFQKWLLLASTLVALVLLSVAIYRYERYHRGPDERVLVGTWEDQNVRYSFKSDHTFEVSERGSVGPFAHGVWHAGGGFAYLLRPVFDDSKDVVSHPLIIWRIDDVSADELRFRLNPGSELHTLRRASSDSRPASNHALQPTLTGEDIST